MLKHKRAVWKHAKVYLQALFLLFALLTWLMHVFTVMLTYFSLLLQENFAINVKFTALSFLGSSLNSILTCKRQLRAWWIVVGDSELRLCACRFIAHSSSGKSFREFWSWLQENMQQISLKKFQLVVEHHRDETVAEKAAEVNGKIFCYLSAVNR